MKRHGSKIIIAAIIVCALAVAWFYGGNYNKNSDEDLQTVTQDSEVAQSDIVSPVASPESSEPAPAPDEPDAPTDDSNGETPLPVEPQDAITGDGAFSVTLTVRCDTILNNMNLLDKEKHELVPEDGVILPVTTVTAYEGESVFNVLQRTMKQAGIHMTFRNTPIYNSAYIEAINNIYEFDAGELSGWMYNVNGWYPNYGCSRYQLKPGDAIEWRYTCDLGFDLGQTWLDGGRQIDD